MGMHGKIDAKKKGDSFFPPHPDLLPDDAEGKFHLC